MPSTTDTPAPLVAGQYPGFQTSEACDNPMVEPAKPLPWQVRYGDTVADATGAKVAACWRPETARMIVDAMNGREEVRAAMNAILATIAISDQGFMTKENALKVIENMVRDALKKMDENEQEGGAS